MKRAYYSNTIQDFLLDDSSKILGELSLYHTHALEELQRNAWMGQIKVLKDQLKIFQEGQIYFEFAIPRMGKRVDVIVIIKHIVFVIEFKVGDGTYGNHAIEQVIDYTLDLKNFHEGSHHAKLIPVIVSTNAIDFDNDQKDIETYFTAAKTNGNNLGEYLDSVPNQSKGNPINVMDWETSIYKPTPTIVEAAKALYKGHNVQEISRSDAGAINLSKTAEYLSKAIEYSKTHARKSICFVTGVPGAGKTLAGLNIANERMKSDEDEHAVFLSGNGPLVEVLREALTRDEVLTAKEKGESLTKKQAAIKANAFIQNIHHFRDDNLISHKAPVERVVVFDEAQRAWTNEKATSFMKVKKGIADFNMSEPEFLINVMNRHDDWCTIICLIGGGQEINTGEAGLEAWINALKDHYSDWDIHYSDLIDENDNYIRNRDIKNWINRNGIREQDLHLAVSVRSFRSEQLSNFIHELLELNFNSAKNLYGQIKDEFPVFITRDLEVAKNWLRGMAKGTERTGVVGSSGARRLRSFGIDVKNEIAPSNWFLDGKNDVRSSYFLEVVATEFDIQGLEIDWTCLAWGADLYLDNDQWNYQKFKGSKWQNINQEIIKQYLKNAYRVLLTRARQGMVIFIPEGSDIDHTRPKTFYEGTYSYLKNLGIKEIHEKMFKDLKVEKSTPPLKRKSFTSKEVSFNIVKKLSDQTQIEWSDNGTQTKMKIGKFVKTSLMDLIAKDLISDEEIRRMESVDYSRNTFHIQYPILKRVLPSDPNNILRYWSGKVNIKGKQYFVCSEWYEQPTNNDRPYFVAWLGKIKNQE